MKNKIEHVIQEYHEKKVLLILQKACNKIAKDSVGDYFKNIQPLISNDIICIPNTTMWLLDSPISGCRDYYALSSTRNKFAFENDFVPSKGSIKLDEGGGLDEITHHLGLLSVLINEFMINRGNELFIKDFSAFLYVITYLYLEQVANMSYYPSNYEDLAELTDLTIIRFFRNFLMTCALRKSDYNPNIYLGIVSAKEADKLISEYNSKEHSLRFQRRTFEVKFDKKVYDKMMRLLDLALLKYHYMYNTHQVPKVITVEETKKSASYEVIPSISQAYSEVVINLGNLITYFNLKSKDEIISRTQEVYSYAQTINIARAMRKKVYVRDYNYKDIILKVIITNCGSKRVAERICGSLASTDSQLNENYPYTFIYELEYGKKGEEEYGLSDSSNSNTNN